MIELDASVVIDDLLRCAADDYALDLDGQDRRRLSTRMAELLKLAGVDLVRERD